MRLPRPSLRVSAIVLVVVGLFGAGGLGAAAMLSQGAVLQGVHVAGTHVGGLGELGVERALSQAAEAAESRELQIIAGELQWARTPKDLGIAINIDATVQRALNAGRGNPVQLIRQSIGKRPLMLGWVPKVDEDIFNESITAFYDDILQSTSSGSVRLVGGDVVISPPAEGVTLLLESARTKLLSRALDASLPSQIVLSLRIDDPSIETIAIDNAAARAAEMLSQPVTFVHESQSATISPEDLAGVLEVRLESDLDGRSRKMTVQANPALTAALLTSALPGAIRPAVDASFRVEGATAFVVPGQEGTGVDPGAAADSINQLNVGSRGPIPLPLTATLAEFTTEDAQALGIVERVSTFTTSFDARNAPRVKNIDLMSDAIDGVLVMPGATFSLNQTTGPRDASNGYQEALIIINGELVPGIGGGVCQFGTTLFNSVFFAGLDVEERYNHSLYFSHYPLGRDATVYFDGGRDFRFVNDTPHGMLLKTQVNRSSLTISLFSTSMGREVSYTTSSKRNFKAPPTKYIDDPSLSAGEEVVVESGSSGFDITVTRTVTSGETVVHSDSFVSRYRPWKRVVRRGTGPPKPEPPPPPEPLPPEPTPQPSPTASPTT